MNLARFTSLLIPSDKGFIEKWKVAFNFYRLSDLPAVKTKTFKNGYKCLVHKRLYYLMMHTENIQKSAWSTLHAAKQSSLYNK